MGDIIDYGDDCTILNVLKTTELYILGELHGMSIVSISLLKHT